MSAPESCPECRTPAGKDARFCSSCGTKLVGLRPVRAPGPFATASTPPAASAPMGSEAAAATEPAPAGRDELAALAENLPKVQPRKSNMLGNVLLFAAACSVFLVVMYAVNKDEAKTISPFQGGPPPMQGAASRPPAANLAQPEPVGAAGAAAAAGETPAVSGSPVRGRITIDPSLAGSAPQGTVFLVVRPAGSPDRGPPIAAKKFEQPTFPLTFEVGPNDVMMQGVPFEGPFDISARLDADGNAMTKAPGDLTVTAPKAGVKPGATDVEIVLDKRL